MYSHHHNLDLATYLSQKCGLLESDGLTFDPRPRCSVFDVKQMMAVTESHSPKSNLYRNHKYFLKLLGETNGNLPWVQLTDSIFESLDDLKQRFPNFCNVIEFYREHFALAVVCGNGIFQAEPLLLLGEPGIGKTAFCHALSEIVYTHCSFVSLAGMTAGFVIGGMSSSWADGKPRKVVESLAVGLVANPLIVLDELDKASADNRYDPHGPLYSLLEKKTAKNFIDECLEIAVDCSQIVWIATANDIERIPEPIRSRLTLAYVQPPDTAQMGQVIQSIYQNLTTEHAWGTQFSHTLRKRLMEKVLKHRFSPRLIQRELLQACGRAALRYQHQSRK